MATRAPHLPLAGRTALVTGATAGIGAATARAFAAAGARLVLVARRAERLAALSEELAGAPGGRPETCTLDVRDADALAAAAAGRGIDLAVANAGLGLGLAKLPDGRPEDWATMLDTNVRGVLHTIRAVLPGMREQRRGDLVLLGSVAGRQVYPGGNVYNASKHAVRALYEALRLDNLGSGVRFTTVDPGMVATEFSVVRFDGDTDAARRVYEGMTPLSPDDVADAILYAVTRPPHVNVGEVVLWPTDQASTRDVARS
jgi:3-hydroxy acid dehydrogenase/malonic semialdehyde reductase